MMMNDKEMLAFLQRAITTGAGRAYISAKEYIHMRDNYRWAGLIQPIRAGIGQEDSLGIYLNKIYLYSYLDE
jgi:hypothetical protein